MLAPVGLKMGVMVTVGGDEGGAGAVGPPPPAGVMANISSWQMGFAALLGVDYTTVMLISPYMYTQTAS